MINCPECNSTDIDSGFCYDCECLTYDSDDCNSHYNDSDNFEQPDSRDMMAFNLHTNEFKNEAYK